MLNGMPQAGAHPQRIEPVDIIRLDHFHILQDIGFPAMPKRLRKARRQAGDFFQALRGRW
jgi:hypothetical protein